MNEVQIAKEFCQILNWWLNAEEMAEVVRRNAEETNPNICHSHDFCDANEAMIVAFENYELDPIENMELCNKAWDLAKAAEFDGSKI